MSAGFIGSADTVHRAFIAHGDTVGMTGLRRSAAPEPAELVSGQDYICAACGYGIAPHGRIPDTCPMCGGSAWLPSTAVRVVERAA